MATTTNRRPCPRCSGRLYTDEFNETACLCGYRDYGSLPEGLFDAATFERSISNTKRTRRSRASVEAEIAAIEAKMQLQEARA